MKLYILVFISILSLSCRQIHKEQLSINSQAGELVKYSGPKAITRNIVQDKEGNIWLAAFDGVFKYDGKSFQNVMSIIWNQARFFSLIEDSKGTLWFGSIGSGVFRYDGKVFKNFTTNDGLLNNEVVSVYEDTKGNIWFGVSGGASCYDGKSFRNYIIDENNIKEDLTGKTFADRQPYEVNSIIEDKSGKFWFATRGNTFIKDGNNSTVLSFDGKSFRNVRTIIEDKKGNIWFSGNDGLWRIKDGVFKQFEKRFTGYIMEDKKGNIWASSDKGGNSIWILSKYESKSLSNAIPKVTEVSSKSMIFGIFEAKDGRIWFGHTSGVSRYDGNSVVDFSEKEN